MGSIKTLLIHFNDVSVVEESLLSNWGITADNEDLEMLNTTHEAISNITRFVNKETRIGVCTDVSNAIIARLSKKYKIPMGKYTKQNWR